MFEYNFEHRYSKNPSKMLSKIYYNDWDSSLYYLQSRYYDPVTHRFINADGLVSTGTGVLGHNMFAYCDNNPVSYTDSSGDKKESAYEMQVAIANKSSSYNIMDVTMMQMAYAGTTDSGIDVYIVTEPYTYIPDGNNVVVNDFRMNANSDMQVIGSYLITEYRDMEQIASILVEYNKMNPVGNETRWDLEVDSIVSEWTAHNFLNALAPPYRIDNFLSADFDMDQKGRWLMNALF